MRPTTTTCGVDRSDRDGGQVTPLMAAFLAVAALMMMALIGAVELVVDRTHAQTAADAAALAGVIDGREAATNLAEANGAVLEEYVERGNDVQVVVRVGRMRARATARAEPGPATPTLARTTRAGSP